jgi:hypothetical protein
VSDLDDLVAALVQGDPAETVPTDIVTAMAVAAMEAHWIPCPHSDFTTEYTFAREVLGRHCQRCGARLIVEPEGNNG